jgi:hypothetical protein
MTTAFEGSFATAEEASITTTALTAGTLYYLAANANFSGTRAQVPQPISYLYPSGLAVKVNGVCAALSYTTSSWNSSIPISSCSAGVPGGATIATVWAR